MKLRTGDMVAIISGKDKGKSGKVLRVLPKINRIVVEGINMRIRHIKKTAQQAGQRVSYEASLSASNVMLLDPKTKKPTRVGYKIDEKTGRKSRFAKKSGEVISVSAAPKDTKKTAGSAKTAEKKAEKIADKPASPAKNPFWKRGGQGKGGDTQVDGAAADTKAMPSVHRSQGG